MTYKPAVTLFGNNTQRNDVVHDATLVLALGFGTAVHGVTADVLVVHGAVLSSLSARSDAEFGVELSLGASAAVCVDFVGNELPSTISPLPVSVEPFCVIYEPTVQLSWVSGFAPLGGATSLTTVRVAATFLTGVAGLTLSDFEVDGAVATGLEEVSSSLYIVNLTLGASSEASCALPAHAGNVQPPNAASAVLATLYKPQPTLTWSDGLLDASTTSLSAVTITANFPTAVMGVAPGDFTIHGGLQAGGVASCGPLCVALPVILTANAVSASMAVSTGSISPPNAESNTLSLTYLPKFAWTLGEGLSVGAVTSQPTVKAIASLPPILSVSGISPTVFSLTGCTLASFEAATDSNSYVCA